MAPHVRRHRRKEERHRRNLHLPLIVAAAYGGCILRSSRLPYNVSGSILSLEWINGSDFPRCASVMSNPSFSLQGIISHKACIILAFDPGVPYSNKPKAKQSHVTEGGQTLTHVRQKNSDLPLLVASVAPEQALGTSPHFGGIEDIGGGKRLQVRCRLAWHCLVCKFWSISFFFAFCSTIWPLVTLQDTIHMRWTGTTGSRCPWRCPKVERLGTKPSIATTTAYPNVSFAYFRFVVSNVCQIGRTQNPSST